MAMTYVVAKNLSDIHDIIRKTAVTAQRNVDDISLIAVSKKQPESRVQAALNAGHRVFGENRVQEAQSRWQDRRAGGYPDLSLHLIGPLQSNKAADAVALFDVIHTVDREKIARALSSEMDKQERHLPCFIQVNTGEEEQKSGVLLNELEDFLSYCRNEVALNIIGLMTIPPVDEHAAFHFALLRKYAAQFGLKHLSMGMSSDMKSAIKFGATHIRVGTGIFGER